MNSYTSPTTKPLYRGTQIVWYVIGLIEILLVFRFLLKLFAANPNAGFTSVIYSLTQPLAAPFLSVFRISHMDGAVFEWTTLLALLVYTLIGWGVTRLLVMSKTVSTPEAAVKLDQQER